MNETNFRIIIEGRICPSTYREKQAYVSLYYAPKPDIYLNSDMIDTSKAINK